LFKLLEPFARNGVSLTRIESRPSHCVNWEYVFFLDIEGHVENPKLSAALSELAGDAELVKVLGSYPRAVL
jgi:chorismate mutase/prephenate dehydratase